MNYKGLIAILFCLILVNCNSSVKNSEKSTGNSESVLKNDTPVSVQMGESIIKEYPDLWSIENRDTPRWTYTYGLVSQAYLDLYNYTHNQKYYNYAKSYIDALVDENGTIKTYKKSDFNIDKINSGKLLFRFYDDTKNEKYKIALDTLRAQLIEHPRTSVGGFWHKKRYPHQMWLDGLYMGAPFYARYGKEFDEPQDFDDVANWLIQMEKVARDSVTGLFYHGWDESREQKWADKETGQSSNFWGRGMGWYAMALVDVLDYFPLGHPMRDSIIDITRRYAKAIVNIQDKDSGVWYQVLDQGNREGNYFEGSVSAMFTYFLFKAVDKGYIAKKYEKNAIEAFEGIVKHLMIVKGDGSLVITPVCAVAGLGGNPYRDGSYEYYINEKKRDNDPKAVGPFIMAAIYYDKLKNK